MADDRSIIMKLVGHTFSAKSMVYYGKIHAHTRTHTDMSKCLNLLRTCTQCRDQYNADVTIGISLHIYKGNYLCTTNCPQFMVFDPAFISGAADFSCAVRDCF